MVTYTEMGTDCPTVPSENFVAVNDDTACTAPIMADKGLLDVQISKNIIDTDSDVENEMNNAAPVPKSSKIMNILKRKFNSLPISNRLQKEDRDSLLCRLDKVFKSNGIVKDAVDFLHHENPPTWAGIEPQPQAYKASSKPTTLPSRRKKKKKKNAIL
ncbi:hypothetical protein TNCV_915331 [Trichonephila clavipes]|nr:hypothetical protein TNCV_915331 [Trichonephila clavipes]